MEAENRQRLVGEAPVDLQVKTFARSKPVTARQREIVWAFPGTDSRLIVDVDFDEYGVPHINDVMDATRQPFPFDEIEYQGEPLADVLFQYLCDTPADELRSAP